MLHLAYQLQTCEKMNAEFGELSAAEIQMIHDMRRERQEIRASSKVRFPYEHLLHLYNFQ